MNNKKNFKTMINSFGVIATGAFAKRVLATVENSEIEEILKEDVFTHVEELTETYLETLDFPTLVELDTAVRRLRDKRQEEYSNTLGYLGGCKTGPDLPKREAANALLLKLSEYGRSIFRTTLNDQAYAYDRICAILSDESVTEQVTLLGLTEWVAAFLKIHQEYETKYLELGDFLATHQVPSALKAEMSKSLKDLLDLIRNKSGHTKNVAIIELDAKLFRRVKETYKSRKRIKSVLDELENLDSPLDAEEQASEPQPSANRTDSETTNPESSINDERSQQE